MKNIGNQTYINPLTRSRQMYWSGYDDYMKREKRNQMNYDFERHDREAVRRERFRHVRSGTIIPANRMPPQLMVKNSDGQWVPEIKRHE